MKLELSKIIRPLPLLWIMLIAGSFPFHNEALAAMGSAPIEVSNDGRISADMEDHPLEDVFRLLSEKHIMGIKGPLPRGMVTTVRFFDLSLEQAMFKMMRGYNYALIKQDTSDTWTVMVLSVAKRGIYGGPEATGQTLRQSGGGTEPVAGRPAGPNAIHSTGVPSAVRQARAPGAVANQDLPQGRPQVPGAAPGQNGEEKSHGD